MFHRAATPDEESDSNRGRRFLRFDGELSCSDLPHWPRRSARTRRTLRRRPPTVWITLQPDALTMPDDRPRAAGSRLRQLWPDRQDVSAVTGSFGARRHRQRQRYEWERREFLILWRGGAPGSPPVVDRGKSGSCALCVTVDLALRLEESQTTMSAARAWTRGVGRLLCSAGAAE